MTYIYVAVPYIEAAILLASGLGFAAGMLALCALRGGSVEAPKPPALECAHGRILNDFCPTCEAHR